MGILNNTQIKMVNEDLQKACDIIQKELNDKNLVAANNTAVYLLTDVHEALLEKYGCLEGIHNLIMITNFVLSGKYDCNTADDILNSKRIMHLSIILYCGFEFKHRKWKEVRRLFKSFDETLIINILNLLICWIKEASHVKYPNCISEDYTIKKYKGRKTIQHLLDSEFLYNASMLLPIELSFNIEDVKSLKKILL